MGSRRRVVGAMGVLAAVGFGCRGAQHEAVPELPRTELARLDTADAAIAQAEPTPISEPNDPWAPHPDVFPEASTQDYAAARGSFHTKLVRTAPPPWPWGPTVLRSSAREITYTSAGRKLTAWISSKPKGATARAPAVLFLHGGFAFGEDDWDMTQWFRDAGFVVMVPILRGENGSPGAFSLYYDEVDDVLAAADVLAKQPDVDASKIFAAGHSAGGTLALLAAMTSKRFKAVASMSGSPDVKIFADQPEFIRFDPSDENEFRMRSPIVFATSLKCPTRLYVGNEETIFLKSTWETSKRAKAARLDVETVVVAGNHMSMTYAAIPAAIEFFQQQR